jgi:hypothetical protein
MDWLSGWPLHNVEIRWKVSLFKIVWQSKNYTIPQYLVESARSGMRKPAFI